jgi:hypothetical protein
MVFVWEIGKESEGERGKVYRIKSTKGKQTATYARAFLTDSRQKGMIS